MKKYLSVALLSVAVPVASWSQANLDSELARELDQLYLQQQAAPVAHPATVQTVVQAAPAAGTYMVPAPGTAVVPAPVVVQQQPTTVIEASPLQESRGEQARRRRQQQEMANEQRIVEKLEEDRLRAEQERLNRVFPGAVNSTTTNVVTDQQQTVVTNPQQVVVVGEQKKETNVSIETDVHHDLGFGQAFGRPYISGAIGWSEYLDASYIRSKVATGVAVGKNMANNLVIEGSFMYSNHDIYDIYYGGYGGGYYGGGYGGAYACSYACGTPAVEMQQYNFMGAVKYEFMTHTIRPSIGGFAGLTYRNYRDKSYTYANPYTYNYNFNGYSYAFDLGLSAGLDVVVNRNFIIGAEGKYVFNAKNWASSDPIHYMMYNGSVKTIEDLSYYTFTLNMKFGF